MEHKEALPTSALPTTPPTTTPLAHAPAGASDSITNGNEFLIQANWQRMEDMKLLLVELMNGC